MDIVLRRLQSLHTDGVLWKTTRIWDKAVNPDAQVSSLEELVKMLLSIPNINKRAAYVERICSHIAEEIKTTTEAIENVEDAIKEAEKKLLKLERKKSLDDEEQLMLEELPDTITRYRNELAELKKKLWQPISKSDLSKAVKEENEQRERKRRQQLAREHDNKNAYSKEQLGLPADFDGNIKEVARYSLYEWRRRYYSKRGEQDWEEISNFTMRIIYFVQTGDDTAYRLIEVTNWTDYKVVVKINTDELTSVGSFKKILARQGDFVFKGNDADLSRLAEYLQKDEKPTKFIHVLGYNPREKFYAFANGIIDTSQPESGLAFHQADEYGIVSLHDKNYFLPALSKMYEDKEHLYGNEKKFVYVENKQVNFETWSKLHYAVYGNKGCIGQLWYILILFMDIVYDIREIRSTPLLFLAGQRGSGKGKYGDSLNVLFGYGQDPISLGSHSTPKGFLRKFAQLKNTFVWLDEYKNSIKKDFIEALKNIFDHLSYTRAQKTTGFENESLPVNSAGLVSGQEIPISEPALYSRCILLQFEPGKNRTEEEKKNFKRLKDMEVHGLSCITHEVLKYRPVFIQKFSTVYDEKLKQMYSKVSNQVDDRFVSNIAILATIRTVLDTELAFPYSIADTEKALVHNLEEQFKIMEGNDDLGKWWEIVQLLVSQGIIKHNLHFRIEGMELYVKIQDIHGLYANELNKRRDPNILPKATLENYLKNDSQAYVEYKKAKIPTNGMTSYWCHVFRYNVLQDRYKIELSGYSRDNHSTITPELSGTPTWDELNSPEKLPFG